MMLCPACDGGGCSECNQSGRIRIDTCPQEMIDNDTVDIMRIAGFWKQGIPPMAGGYMDQLDNVAEACSYIWSEQNRAMEASRKK